MAALPLAEPVKRRLSAALHDTATPTILRAGTKINVIPARPTATWIAAFCRERHSHR